MNEATEMRKRIEVIIFVFLLHLISKLMKQYYLLIQGFGMIKTKICFSFSLFQFNIGLVLTITNGHSIFNKFKK